MKKKSYFIHTDELKGLLEDIEKLSLSGSPDKNLLYTEKLKMVSDGF